jgi:hypothetical protein
LESLVQVNQAARPTAVQARLFLLFIRTLLIEFVN